jgi:hypothetical protein
MVSLPMKKYFFAALAFAVLLASAALASAQVDKVMADAEGIT